MYRPEDGCVSQNMQQKSLNKT